MSRISKALSELYINCLEIEQSGKSVLYKMNNVPVISIFPRTTTDRYHIYMQIRILIQCGSSNDKLENMQLI